MIIPKLYGRLGNQCFQVAAAIAHAKKMGTGWAIPRSTNDMRIWPNYFLHTVPPGCKSFGAPTRDIYNESRHCFDELPTHTQSLTINGYFQSEKYWPGYEEKFEIGSALGFHSRAYEHEAEGKGYISVHVRRGDYVTDYSNHHPPLTIQYYQDAVEYFMQQGNNLFKIYSDDVDYCENIFSDAPFEGINFKFSTIKDPVADMRDMYNASGFIIANSTFSLFPALLRLDNPKVIAPAESRWYGPANAHLQTFDLMPERFIKI